MHNFIRKNRFLETFIFKFIPVDFTSTFIHLLVVVRKSKNEKQSAAEELSYENCVLNNLFRQIRVYINGAYRGINITLPNIARYIQFMLINSIPCLKLVRCSHISREYRLQISGFFAVQIKGNYTRLNNLFSFKIFSFLFGTYGTNKSTMFLCLLLNSPME